MFFLFIAREAGKWNPVPKDTHGSPLPKTEIAWIGNGPFDREDVKDAAMLQLLNHPTNRPAQVLSAHESDLPRFAASTDKALAAAAAEMLALFPVEGETDQPPV